MNIISTMNTADLRAALELFRRTGTLPDHRQKLEAEYARRQKSTMQKEAA